VSHHNVTPTGGVGAGAFEAVFAAVVSRVLARVPVPRSIELAGHPGIRIKEIRSAQEHA